MSDKALLPFRAINIYMNQEYLESVLATTLSGVKKLPKKDQIAFSQFMKKYVNVLGFRDPSRAPFSLRVKALARVFEEKDEVVPVVLSIWTKTNKKLVKPVKAWLEGEGFKNLATERVYTEESGFIAEWPKKLAFEKMVKKFQKDNPEVKIEQDDLILLALWITGQLPSD